MQSEHTRLKKDAMKLPRIVQEAQQFQYPVPITGYLVNAQLQSDDLIFAYIFCDTKSRFEDGALISTSSITEISVDLPRHVAHTRTGSHYVICNYYFPHGFSDTRRSVSIGFRDICSLQKH
ncbi:hypothetical protein AL065_25380 [Pseudomonas amygdali pv. ulmi]|nr:hypothetical protein AL065_25380 [Pseudomonas amygdali pv. ulmi]